MSSTTPTDTRSDVPRLYEEAMRKLDDDAYEEAIALGDCLERLGFSGAFEVIALARAGQDDLEGAVATLRRGVSVAPSVWLLWQMLGNYLSDLERADEALEAYARALGCPGADRASVHYNRALALSRAGRHADALAACDEVVDGPCAQRAAFLRARTLNWLGRHEEAFHAGEALLARLEEGGDDGSNDRENALGECALALLKGRRDEPGALRMAEEAIGGGRFVSSAAEVMRLVRGARSPRARALRLRVGGRWLDHPDRGSTGFLRVFQVIAETPEQALAYARDFEPTFCHASLHVEHVEGDELAPDALEGVYWASGHVLFPLERDA
jgi:tetratricopeptide (TPR) repeat protein